jgi:hypothetical protein
MDGENLVDTIRTWPPPQPQVNTSAAIATAKLTIAAAFLVAGSASAALIEISIPPSSTPLGSLVAERDADVDPSFLPWEDPSWGSAHNVLAGNPAIGRRPGFGVHAVPGSSAAFPPLSDIGIPVPINPTHHDAWDTEVVQAGPLPDLWTTLLVAAGLIAYQIRRKLKTGAVRIESQGLGSGALPGGVRGNPLGTPGIPAPATREPS